MWGSYISNIYCGLLFWVIGLIGVAIASNSDCWFPGNFETIPRPSMSQLDTVEDLGGFLGWSADSQIMRGYLYYAKSSAEIDLDILDLTNPEDFNPDEFTNAEGIWYFPFKVLFENSDDPILLNFATFNYSGATVSMTNVYVRYYLHGFASFHICTFSGCSKELYNNNGREEWQEVLVSLNDIKVEDDLEFDETTGNLVYIEFQTMVRNVDFLLLDKIIISTPEQSMSTTTPGSQVKERKHQKFFKRE